MNKYKIRFQVYIEDESKAGSLQDIYLSMPAASFTHARVQVRHMLQRLLNLNANERLAVNTSVFRAGDHVEHLPTAERWVLAYAIGEGDDARVAACGWPESEAYARDCALVKAATDEEHEKMLREWAEKPHRRDDGSTDRRRTVCISQLEALGAEKNRGPGLGPKLPAR